MLWFRPSSTTRLVSSSKRDKSTLPKILRISGCDRFPTSWSCGTVSAGRRNFVSFQQGTPTTTTITTGGWCCWTDSSYYRDQHHQRWDRFFSSSVDSTTTATTGTMNEESNDTDNSNNHYEFKAETRQLLDIVTHSLYTDREVFLRELVSNASDACEKLRHLQAANMLSSSSSSSSNNDVDSSSSTVDENEKEIPLEIRITTNDVDQTLTISDTGIGFTKDDMIKNLGTIAASGSKAFVQALQARPPEDRAGVTAASQGIIGKFGVGFYSSFMVGDVVHVRSRSAIQGNENPHEWSSTGEGTYNVKELPSDIEQERGSSVIIHLKDQYAEYCSEARIKELLTKYSNFVNFPIFLNGTRINTIQAVWAMEPSTVDDETHNQFYKYIAKAFDVPITRLHFRADAPIEVKALFYVPSFHSERNGMERMKPGVGLYCRKVLIENHSPDILPDWLRFVKGIVDSEDLPLSISREKPQDAKLIRKLRKVLTRKLIAHFATMARKEPETYKFEFFKEYGYFLKEGICQDFEFQDQLSKLLYFETSKTMNGELSSFDEYLSRCKPEQQEIYYLCTPSRDTALESPYLEAFEKNDKEVIFVYSTIDEFVMSNLGKYQDRVIVSVEKGDLDVLEDDNKDRANEKEDNTEKKTEAESYKLSGEEATEFCTWFQTTLKDKVKKAKVTNRLGNSPAIITDHESAALRTMMRMIETSQQGAYGAESIPKQVVEINPAHPIIYGLNEIRKKEPKLAEVCAAQVYDNCLVAAGLMDDGRLMLPRLNELLLCVVKGATSSLDTVDTSAKSDS